MAFPDFIPDIGVDYGHLKIIAMNFYKPTFNPRCEWAIGPHKTWDGQLRVWQCQRRGVRMADNACLCKAHLVRARSLHPETELPSRLFAYYLSLSTH